MSTLLHIDSSPRGPLSITRSLTAEYVAQWRQRNPDGRVLYRDVASEAPLAVDLPWVGAIFTQESELTQEQREILHLSDSLIAELQAADQYVFGVPMINFSVPATFKLYIDQVVRRGKTFAYTAEGMKGLLQGKKATIFTASGSVYSAESPMASMNFVEPYLRTILGFIGVTDLTFVAAENISKVMSGKIGLEEHLAPVRERVRELAAAL